MKSYNKLVRDRIPALMEAQGKETRYSILDGAALGQALEQKLDEEVAEFHADKNLEELADILEVLLALAAGMGYTPEKLEAARAGKLAQRGGFARGYYLISEEE